MANGTSIPTTGTKPSSKKGSDPEKEFNAKMVALTTQFVKFGEINKDLNKGIATQLKNLNDKQIAKLISAWNCTMATCY